MFKSEVAFFTNREADRALGYLDLFLKDVWLQIDLLFYLRPPWFLGFEILFNKKGSITKIRISKE